MNQPDDVFAGKLVRALQDEADGLSAETRGRLAAARRQAMSRYRERPEPAWNMAWVLSAVSLGSAHGHQPARTRFLLASAVVVLALVGVGYWQSTTSNGDFSDIDVNLLTDELPINAYLDNGFDSWLKRGSR